ncbi:Non-specific serine/threonine protein kinase protein [Dioscorea alata]|nr:Non-specific serine/threonine protein kinase protein [Dioscorea alata]
MNLLCCSPFCPCSSPKGEGGTAHNLSAKELNSKESVTSKLNTSSDAPLRVAPSPPRFSLSPQQSVVGTIQLSINDIREVTQNFSSSCKIGEGGVGSVYRAKLADGRIIAIKRAKKENFAALKAEFSNEVALLTKIEHRSLVRLLGYHDQENEYLIFTEYVPNGTLREHLDGRRGKILNFSQRLEIAIDVAHALTYLHLYAEKTIIHRDVKSSNILLTENLRAKVADFGFARSGSTQPDKTHISTKVKGTAGYLDPEYLKTYKLTPKSDVYSFGMLLIELISARRPVEVKRPPNERITVRWAFDKHSKGNDRDILDPALNDEIIDDEVLQKLLGLAFQCAAPTRADRPDMKEAVEQLWDIRKDYRRKSHRTVP